MGIEKLGITPGPWKFERFNTCNGSVGAVSCNEDNKPEDKNCTVMADCVDDNNGLLIAAAPEMLKTLITSRLVIEQILSEAFGFDSDEPICVKIESIIEKATGKPWAEVKELMK